MHSFCTRRLFFSTTLQVGLQRSTMLMTSNLPVVMGKMQTQKLRKVVQLHSVGLYGMKNLVITMMLLPVSIMMETLVSVLLPSLIAHFIKKLP